MGQSPDSKFYSEEDVGMPFLQGCAEFGSKSPTPKLNCSQIKKVGKAGSLLFSVRAPVGKTNIADRDYIIGRGLAAIKASSIDADYLGQFIEYIEPQFRNASQGSTFEAINSKELSAWPIKFPCDPDEQTQIATILSTLDRAIEQTEAIIAKQQRIKAGLMQDLLTKGIDEHGIIRSEATHQFKDSPLGRIPVEWDVEQLGRIASLQRGYDIVEAQLIPGPAPVISSSGIIGYHNLATSTGPNVVVGRKGSIGNVHYVKTDFWAHDTSLFVTNFYGNNVKYIYYLFTSLDLGRYGTKSGSPSLNRNDIHPLQIGLPKQIEQKRIADVFSTCDENLGKFSGELEKMKRVKTGLMHDLLTGTVRVSNTTN